MDEATRSGTWHNRNQIAKTVQLKSDRINSRDLIKVSFDLPVLSLAGCYCRKKLKTDGSSGKTKLKNIAGTSMSVLIDITGN